MMRDSAQCRLQHIGRKRRETTRAGRAEDCAGIALFLASDDAAYLTGLVVPVDGGTTAATGQGRNSYENDTRSVL
ncbi:SDR family oxidoreductase [Bifidobacterium santillanense]|uniref:SDR family oxidoreductase n=1 Tax=Bifidobacterium santillanense TaxID=2809028 RepID=UPI001F0AE661|nr:SDR family oxidoreductase [Bifidobacterium santillanense]